MGRQRGRRSLLGGLAAVLVGTGVVLTPGAAGAERQAAETIDWQPCADAPEVECARIEVPLDWNDPDGQTTHIGLARRKAKDPEHRIGSLLMDPGGPGGSGVATVEGGDPFTEAVTARFDVIGFDPRGINTSDKLLCDEELSHQAREARHPTSQAEFDHLAGLNEQLAADCRKNSGALVDHVDNIQTVHDMDAIRQALGEEKLNYLGWSYGSLMGQQYAEVFPDHIRAMVTDGNMDHSLRTAWDFMRTETEPVERNFREFAAWCDETPDCALYGSDTRRTYIDLREKAKAGTLVDPESGDPIDFYGLSSMGFAANNPQAWGDLASSLKALRDGTGTVAAKSLAAPAADVVSNPYPPIWCSDWRYPVRSYADYAKLRKRLDRTFPTIQWSPYVDHAMTCVGTTIKTTNPQQRLHVHGAPPLVMVGNVHDMATVYRWNLAAARQSRAHLITYEGYGHTAYHGEGPSECVNSAVDAYLIDLTVPEKGLRCPAMEKPGLGTPASSPKAASTGPYQF